MYLPQSSEKTFYKFHVNVSILNPSFNNLQCPKLGTLGIIIHTKAVWGGPTGI